MNVDGKFGLFLLTQGLINEQELEAARAYQRTHRQLRIGEILVNRHDFGFRLLVETLEAYRKQCLIGELLIQEGAITFLHLEEALLRQANSGVLLGKVLVEMGACRPEQVLEALAVQRGDDREPLLDTEFTVICVDELDADQVRH